MAIKKSVGASNPFARKRNPGTSSSVVSPRQGRSPEANLERVANLGAARRDYQIVTNTKEAIKFTQTRRMDNRKYLVVTMGMPDPIFANPNISGDYVLPDEKMQAQLTEATTLAKKAVFFPLSFQTGLNTLTDTRRNPSDMDAMIGDVPSQREEFFEQCSQDYTGDSSEIEAKMKHIFTSLSYNRMWSIAVGKTTDGITMIFSRDISLPCNPNAIFSKAATEFTESIKKEFEGSAKVVGKLLSDYQIELRELSRQDKFEAVCEQIKKDFEKFTPQIDGSTTLCSFFWIVLIYASIRARLAHLYPDNLTKYGLFPKEKLIEWKRPPEGEIIADDYQVKFEEISGLEAKEIDREIEDYGGEIDNDHRPDFPFFLYPNNTMPRKRNALTFSACNNYVHMIANPEAIWKNTTTTSFTEEPITDKQYYMYEASKVDAKHHITSAGECLRDVIAREKAAIVVRDFIFEHRFIQFDEANPGDNQELSLTEKICKQTPITAYQNFAAVEGVENLFFGFLRSTNLALEKSDIESQGLLLSFPTNGQVQTTEDDLKFKSFVMELQAPIPLGTHRPSVRRGQKNHQHDLDWNPPAVEDILKRAEAVSRNKDKISIQANQLLALSKEDVGSFSRPPAGDKNDSIEWLHSKMVSFVEDYELLPVLILGSQNGTFNVKELKLDQMRYAACLDGKKLKIMKNIKGRTFLGIGLDAMEIEDAGIPAELLEKQNMSRLAELKKRRLGAVDYIKDALLRYEANKKHAEADGKKLAQTTSGNIDLLRDLAKLGRGKAKAEKIRKIVDSLYMAPQRMTQIAMHKLVSASQQTKFGELTYGLPSLDAANTFFATLKTTPAGRMENISKSYTRKSVIEVVNMLGGIVNNEDYADDLISNAVKNLGDLPPEDQIDAEMHNDAVLNFLVRRDQAGGGTSIMPLLYSINYTYEVLFYFAQAFQKILYPMGKTYPDLAWIYATLELSDPTDDMKMRHDSKTMLLSVGGLRLLDAHRKLSTAINPSLTALVAKAAAVGNSSQNAKFVSGCVRFATTCGILFRQSSQIKGRIKRYMHELREALDDLAEIRPRCEAYPKLIHEFNEKMQEFTDIINSTRQGITKSKMETWIQRQLKITEKPLPSPTQALYFCDIGFAKFVSDVIKSVQAFRSINESKKNGSVFWLLDLLMQSKAVINPDVNTPEGLCIFWASMLEPYLTKAALKTARRYLVGSEDRCEDLLKGIREMADYAVSNYLTIGNIRPAALEISEDFISRMFEGVSGDDNIEMEIRRQMAQAEEDKTNPLIKHSHLIR